MAAGIDLTARGCGQWLCVVGVGQVEGDRNVPRRGGWGGQAQVAAACAARSGGFVQRAAGMGLMGRGDSDFRLMRSGV